MQTPQNVEENPAYQRWVYQREVELSRACGQAPEAEKIRFEDEHADSQKQADFELRCRKCRRTLATSRFLVDHKPRTFQSDQTEIQPPPADASLCAHYFVDPLSWMRPELEQGKLDGRLECPKCKTNVGKYAWQGMKCSCNEWVVPAISISKGRIDEVKSRTGAGSDVAGIRRPPAVLASSNRGPGAQNL
ncbi:hypothetical protein W97_01994 [Coniosporium apollinis CBS 100218]|uniref:protein-tyrosine-phosphatase n=1 Tax=Coniosporium apollinis (strain CBS 100218) TaxID=1168221 RepID=R7YLS7_CONA1|nr:uncharacterized protein W97_01994 [Coniosporium apollinis CBS 100218]EON62769.1 hypothetical protein W97_01994 [Coniosporium apollinis CBS 100218]